MKITYLKNKEIDKKKWDNCVKSARNTYIYGFSWFLDIIAVDWDGLIMGDYEAVMPLTKKQKYFIQYLYQPVFIQKVSIYSKNEINSKVINLFINSIPKKFVLVNICLDFENLNLSNRFKIFNNANYELELNKDYDELYSEFRRNTKRNIKTAIKNKIVVKVENTFSDFIETRQERTIARKAKNIKDFHFKRLEKLLTYLQDSNSLKIYNAYTEDGIFCASSCYYFSGNRATISHIATEYGLSQKANFLTVDQFIKDNCNNDLILDLAGSNIKGIAYFNSGFGASNKPYLRIYRNKIEFIKK